MPLHPGQIRYLKETTSSEVKIGVLVPSNRWGKSSLIACKQIWKLFYKHGIRTGNRDAWAKAEYRTANIAPHSALVEPVFKYIDQIMTSKFPINLPDGRVVTNKCLIEWFYNEEKTTHSAPYKQYFSNNSYIEHRTIGATGSDSLEGKPYGYISYDEGGRSDHLEDQVNGTLLARLFDWQGQLDIVSTPDQNSPSILYHYKLYQDGLAKLNRTYTQEGRLRDNIFFSPEQIQEQYDLYKNNPMRDQVLEGKFLLGGSNLYSADEITDAVSDELNDGKPYEEGHQYAIGVDTAMSTDEMVFDVLDITNDRAELVWQMACKGNSKSPQMHVHDFIELCDAYSKGGGDHSNLFILLETWNGESARFYQDLPYHLQNRTKCYGSWQPSKQVASWNKNAPPKPNANVKKADILISLKKRLSARELLIPNDQKLKQELAVYREDDSKLQTDRVIALALACYMADEGKKSLVPTIAWIAVDW